MGPELSSRGRCTHVTPTQGWARPKPASCHTGSLRAWRPAGREHYGWRRSVPLPAPATYLTITEVDEWGLFPARFEEFGLEELPIKVHPRAAVFPGHGLATRVVGKQGHVHAAHEESRELDAPRVEVLNL